MPLEKLLEQDEDAEEPSAQAAFAHERGRSSLGNQYPHSHSPLFSPPWFLRPGATWQGPFVHDSHPDEAAALRLASCQMDGSITGFLKCRAMTYSGFAESDLFFHGHVTLQLGVDQGRAVVSVEDLSYMDVLDLAVDAIQLTLQVEAVNKRLSASTLVLVIRTLPAPETRSRRSTSMEPDMQRPLVVSAPTSPIQRTPALLSRRFSTSASDFKLRSYADALRGASAHPQETVSAKVCVHSGASDALLSEFPAPIEVLSMKRARPALALPISSPRRHAALGYKPADPFSSLSMAGYYLNENGQACSSKMELTYRGNVSADDWKKGQLAQIHRISGPTQSLSTYTIL